MPSLEVTQVIAKPPETIYQMICAMEDFPLYMETIKSVLVVKRGASKIISSWTVVIDGLELNWLELDEFLPAERRIEGRQISGDLEHYQCSWQVRPHPEGSFVSLKLDFELGLSILGGTLSYLLVKKVRDNCEDMLKWLKETAEKGNMSIMA